MKKSIKVALAGLFAVPVLAFGLAVVPSASQSVSAVECLTIQCGADTGKTDSGPTKLLGDGGIFTNIINIALYVIGALAVLMLIVGGIRYTISGGDTAAVTAAKNTILYAIIGIVIAVLAYAIVNFVLNGLTAGN